ncbi:hypothetical protein DC31_08550 [Microbacterium sp. CH12i]|uniref:hypothetical protein n=1 Tax=Microbacterium sp. CH12i TaxID=1479651 RepID=UPI000460EBA1|nr:hypothetical protein [Microbacterium sp. CH12i]KDA06672.1 hypothetical protein DC31_08550 [Microbacterium sp. CH12i]
MLDSVYRRRKIPCKLGCMDPLITALRTYAGPFFRVLQKYETGYEVGSGLDVDGTITIDTVSIAGTGDEGCRVRVVHMTGVPESLGSRRTTERAELYIDGKDAGARWWRGGPARWELAMVVTSERWLKIEAQTLKPPRELYLIRIAAREFGEGHDQ